MDLASDEFPVVVVLQCFSLQEQCLAGWSRQVELEVSVTLLEATGVPENSAITLILAGQLKNSQESRYTD